ncbi:hypothetical protein PINS_up006451 [Pythium insidiosum]|nr:hypothetical protein PINS_up006451 [Pythium insidiosum]
MPLYEGEQTPPAHGDALNVFSSSTSSDALPLSLHEVVTTETLYDAHDTLDLSATDWIVAGVLTQDLQCRYRKGKCDRPRTLKKNGNLHSFCEFHRQRSIRNQRKFDRKRRLSAAAGETCRTCHGPLQRSNKDGGDSHSQELRPATSVQRQNEATESGDLEGISEAVWV